MSFDLHAGEILGLFGLVGAGRTELLETLFGLRRVGGRVARDRRRLGRGRRRGPFAPRSAGDAIAAGLALVPEDRKSQGLVAEMSVGDNLSLAALARRPLAGVARPRRRAPPRGGAVRVARRSTAAAGGRGAAALRRQPAEGRARQVVGGRAPRPPPRRAHARRRRRRAGRDPPPTAPARRRAVSAILLSSAETEEILALADRVLVLRRGAIAGTLEGAERTEQNLLRLAAGGSPDRRHRPTPRRSAAP